MAAGSLGPSLGGFIEFVTSVMAPPSPFNAATSVYVPFAYDSAYQFANTNLQCVPGMPGAWTLYALAVYNLAADTLITFVQDGPDDPDYKDDLPYWTWLRKQFQVLSPNIGIVQSTSDQGTSTGLLLPNQYAEFTIANVQQSKTPYGRAYLGYAGSWGSQWGMS